MSLKTVLDSLLASSPFANGDVVSRRLPKGLTIRLKRQGDLVSVQLSREDAPPSREEWKTVLDHWPGQVTVIEEPKELTPQGKRRFLRGKVRTSPQLVE